MTDLANRPRCVNVYWRKGRHVRVLHPAFGYQGKIATIEHVGAEKIYVSIKTGKKPWEVDQVAYYPGQVKLI